MLTHEARLRRMSQSSLFTRAQGAGSFRAVESEGQKVWSCTINTLDVDSYGTIIHPDGVKLERFLANPVVYHAHGWERGEMPIGRCLTLDVKDDRIDARFVLAEGVEPADSVRKLLEQDIMRGVSVTFLPITMRPEQIDGEDVYHIEEWELVEFSILGTQSNPTALMHSGEQRAQVLSYPDKRSEVKAHAASLLQLAMTDGADLEQIQRDAEQALAVYGTTLEEIIEHRRAAKTLDVLIDKCNDADPMVGAVFLGMIADASE